MTDRPSDGSNAGSEKQQSTGDTQSPAKTGRPSKPVAAYSAASQPAKKPLARAAKSIIKAATYLSLLVTIAIPVCACPVDLNYDEYGGGNPHPKQSQVAQGSALSVSGDSATQALETTASAQDAATSAQKKEPHTHYGILWPVRHLHTAFGIKRPEDIWDLSALIQVLLVSMLVWLDVHKKLLRVLGPLCLLVFPLVAGLAAFALITHALTWYCRLAYILVVLCALVDGIVLFSDTSNRPLYGRLVIFVDIPVLIAMTLLIFKVYPLTERYAPFFSGAIAFQLMSANLIILLLAFTEGKSKTAVKLRKFMGWARIKAKRGALSQTV